MSKRKPTDLSASIRQRLLNRARERGEDFQLILNQYAVERFLYRLSRSPYADQFVLKGAMLFAAWKEVSHRPTRDVDLLGYGPDSVESMETVLAEIVRTNVEPDGLDFDVGSIRGEEIREEQEYGGVRVRLTVHLAGARIPLQVDVAFGDAVSPGPRAVEYPTLLDLPAPRPRAYPPAPVVAEKFQAMVALGMANTRLKDFYDLWLLSERMSFEGKQIRQAIEATFGRRRTPVSPDAPFALTAEVPRRQLQTGAVGSLSRPSGSPSTEPSRGDSPAAGIPAAPCDIGRSEAAIRRHLASVWPMDPPRSSPGGKWAVTDGGARTNRTAPPPCPALNP